MADRIHTVYVFGATGLALLARQAPSACPLELHAFLGFFGRAHSSASLSSRARMLGKLTQAALDESMI